MTNKSSKEVLEILKDSICKDCEHLVVREYVSGYEAFKNEPIEPSILCKKWYKLFGSGFARVNTPVSTCTLFSPNEELNKKIMQESCYRHTFDLAGICLRCRFECLHENTRPISEKYSLAPDYRKPYFILKCLSCGSKKNIENRWFSPEEI